MRPRNTQERQKLILAIASKEQTATELADEFGYTIEELRKFTEENIKAIKRAHEKLEEAARESALSSVVTPQELSDLWISNKTDRLNRYQAVADKLYQDVMNDDADATTLRELRSYMLAAANELGQLLHRGSGESGDGDKLQVEFKGVDPSVFE